MKFKTLTYITFGTFIAAILVFLFLITHMFSTWRASRFQELQSGSELLEFNDKMIEVAVVGNDKNAPALLLIHCGAGGYDQALALAGNLDTAGFRIIAPSRPGYLRTPLAEGLLPEHQARLMREMLKELDIKKVSVFAFAEGAFSACILALENPDLVESLILLSPILETKGRELPPGLRALDEITGDVGAWWLYRKSEAAKPRKLFKSVFELTQEFPPGIQRYETIEGIIEDPARKENFEKFLQSMTPVSPREDGTRNDDIQLTQPPRIPYGKISCPVLIIGGENDILLPKGSVAKIAERFAKNSNLELKLYSNSGFLVPMGDQYEEYRNDLISFLTKNIKTLPTPMKPSGGYSLEPIK
ncbi:MAG: alpha/beta fold hydrolase [Chthoniobacterales bacterium]